MLQSLFEVTNELRLMENAKKKNLVALNAIDKTIGHKEKLAVGMTSCGSLTNFGKACRSVGEKLRAYR